jgi:hypothetical protein
MRRAPADQSGLLQGGQVPAEVSGGAAERCPQEAELDTAGLVGDGENAEADALVDNVVQAVDGGLVGLLAHERARSAVSSVRPKPRAPSRRRMPWTP